MNNILNDKNSSLTIKSISALHVVKLHSLFTKKKYRRAGNINGGVYLASKDIFDDFDLEDKFSFEKFIQINFKELKARTKVFDNYFIDIGIPEDYEKAQNEILEFKSR